MGGDKLGDVGKRYTILRHKRNWLWRTKYNNNNTPWLFSTSSLSCSNWTGPCCSGIPYLKPWYHYIMCHRCLPVYSYCQFPRVGPRTCQIPLITEAFQLHRFLAKIFEYVLHKGFLDDIEGKTHYLQGEFRKGYGTSHTSCILQEAVLACRSQNQRCLWPSWMPRRHSTLCGTKAFFVNFTSMA